MPSAVETPTDVGRRAAGRVWLSPIDVAADAVDGNTHDWLSDDETHRLQAMTSTTRRRSFLAGHWRARELAGDWLQVDPRRIALHRHDDGRPQLVVDGAASPLSLSLSHSGDWLAIALATVPVGIDVELPRRQRDLRALARFTFSPEEVASLDGLQDDAYSVAFHRLWTLKEARGKRLGEGLLPGRSRLVPASPGEMPHADAMRRPLAHWGVGDRHRSWQRTRAARHGIAWPSRALALPRRRLEPEAHTRHPARLAHLIASGTCEARGLAEAIRAFDADIGREFATDLVAQAQACVDLTQP